MARARGANAVMALAFETTYGVSPNSGFFAMPFASAALGETQKLVASNLLGQGRDPAAPALDVIDNAGDVTVPVDVRAIGYWLRLHFGAPTTTQGVKADGSFTFSAQPAANSTISIGGADWTFVSSGASGDESLIGATLADTLASAVRGLNASATSALSGQTYSLNLAGDTITVAAKTPGTSGNSVTLSASSSPASNATPSGATLSGGSASGPYNHVFASGAAALPSASVEIGNPDVPSYAMSYGVMSDKIAIALKRGGLLDATISLIGQGQAARTGSSQAGTPATVALERFAQFSGQIVRGGVLLGDVVSGNFAIANGLDRVEVIRSDGRIAGADPGEASYTGNATVRFKDTALADLASAGTPIDLSYGWSKSPSKSLLFTFHEVYLPRPQFPVQNAGGIQASYDWQGAKNAAAGRALTVTLVNDVSSYA